MKRVFLFFISLILCFSLTSCNSGTNKKTNKETNPDEKNIQLTLDNYKDYLKISEVSISNYGAADKVLSAISGQPDIVVYNQVKFEIVVEGVSPNYTYNDVTVTFRFKGDCDIYDAILWSVSEDVKFNSPFEFDVTADLNVAGGGNGIYIFRPETPTGFISAHTHKNWFSCNAEIIAVTGTLTPLH